MKLLTLCIVQQDDRVLLGMKKAGFGAGKWNGFGGKVEPGETPLRAAHREMREECGVELRDCTEVGIIDFRDHSVPNPFRVHVYRATAFSGEPVETAEMRPRWIAVDDIPFDRMWPDDRHWLPLLLAGKRFAAACEISAAGELLSIDLREVEPAKENTAALTDAAS